jgi:hypothetical protein
MARRTSVEDMGRKKAEFPSKPVRIAEDVYDNGMIVAAHEKKDLTRYLSEKLRPIIEAELLRYSQQTVQSKAKKSAAETIPMKGKKPAAPG